MSTTETISQAFEVGRRHAALLRPSAVELKYARTLARTHGDRRAYWLGVCWAGRLAS